MSKEKTSAKKALFELFKRGVPLMVETGSNGFISDTFYEEQKYRLDYLPTKLNEFFCTYGQNVLSRTEAEGLTDDFAKRLPKDTLYIKIRSYTGIRIGVATEGIQTLAENMKGLIRGNMSKGGSILYFEMFTKAWLGEEQWCIKNYGNNHDKWLLIRESDGLTYPVNLD